MNKKISESITFPDLKKDRELLQKAETLIDFRDYHIEEISQTASTIDIQASSQDSDEAILMHIITQTDHQNDGVGIDTVKETEHLLTQSEVDKVIIFGHRFTESAENQLHEKNIEFFTTSKNILSILNHQELYNTIFKYVDILCCKTCGSVPKSMSDCVGYAQQITSCPRCQGQGKLVRTASQKYAPYCPECGGSGETESKYRCPTRLISDNADFHFRKGWRRLLHDDLVSLIELVSKK